MAQKIGAFAGKEFIGTQDQQGFGASIATFDNRVVIGAPDSRDGVVAAALRITPKEVLFADGFESN